MIHLDDRLAAEASGDPRALKDYYNGRGALPFKQKELETDEQKILTLRCDLPPRTVPRGAIALTCGVDVQKRVFRPTGRYLRLGTVQE